MYFKEDNPTIIWAVDTTHHVNIRQLLGDDCYTELCARVKLQRTTENTYDDNAIYSIGDTIIYNNVVYTSLQNGNIGNVPDISPLYWAVSGLREIDKTLIKKLQRFAAYLIEYYYRSKSLAGDIENDTVLINMPDNKALPNAKNVQNLLDMLISLSNSEAALIKNFMIANKTIYTCFKDTSDCNTCGDKQQNNGFFSPFIIVN